METQDMNSTQTTVGDLTESECGTRLAGMFRAADVQMRFPIHSDEAAEVLRNGGAYDVSLELLESWARSASVGRVDVRSGRFQWSAGNVLAAAALANAARRWILDSKHIAKMNAIELAELQARAVGESVFCDLDDVDIQTLIGVIAGSDHAEQRSTLCLGLVAKLRHDKVMT